MVALRTSRTRASAARLHRFSSTDFEDQAGMNHDFKIQLNKQTNKQTSLLSAMLYPGMEKKKKKKDVSRKTGKIQIKSIA